MIRKIELGHTVTVIAHGYQGEVVGYAIFTEMRPKALVRIIDSKGDTVDKWWCVDDLQRVIYKHPFGR